MCISCKSKSNPFANRVANKKATARPTGSSIRFGTPKIRSSAVTKSSGKRR